MSWKAFYSGGHSRGIQSSKSKSVLTCSCVLQLTPEVPMPAETVNMIVANMASLMLATPANTQHTVRLAFFVAFPFF